MLPFFPGHRFLKWIGVGVPLIVLGIIFWIVVKVSCAC